MVFVDTGAWFASVVSTDPRHLTMVDWFRHNNQPLVTTDYVVDETLTLLRSRRQRARAISLGRYFFDLSGVPIHHVEPVDITEAWIIFRRYADRDWSFTDCVSKAVIDRLHMKRVLTFDHHFAQFGNLQILP